MEPSSSGSQVCRKTLNGSLTLFLMALSRSRTEFPLYVRKRLKSGWCDHKNDRFITAGNLQFTGLVDHSGSRNLHRLS